MPYFSKLHKPHTCSTKAMQKNLTLNGKPFRKKVRTVTWCFTPSQPVWLDQGDREQTISSKITRQSEKTRQKNRRGDRKGESNYSPEIPDRGTISDIISLPSGNQMAHTRQLMIHWFEKVLLTPS